MIDQIQAGGNSSGFNYLENVSWEGTDLKGSCFTYDVTMDFPLNLSGTFKFTVKEDNVYLFLDYYNGNVSCDPDLKLDSGLASGGKKLEKGTEYSITFNSITSLNLIFYNQISLNGQFINPIDYFGVLYN